MRKKPDRQQIIYEVALGGVAAAMALLLVWLAVVVGYGSIGFFVAACCALLVPLTQKYYFSSIAAYIVSSLLAFAIVGDIFTISGYVIYFAPMCIMSAIMLEKKVKIYIALPIKIVYINLALAFLYYVAGTIMISPDVVEKIPYYAVAIVGTVLLVALDFLMKFVYGVMKPRVSKALRKRNAPVDPSDQNDDTEGNEKADKSVDDDDPPFEEMK